MSGHFQEELSWAKRMFSPQPESMMYEGFPGGSEDKQSVCNAGDPGSIPGWGRSPGEENGNPFS